MQFTVSITRENRWRVLGWTAYLLLFLFNLSLALESYQEYEPTAGRIFLVMTALVGVAGLAAYTLLRLRRKRREAATTS